MNRTPDFNQFGGELWEIANVFRDDALHATERLETFSLFLFLKLLDEKEIEEEEELRRKKTPEEQLIPELYRFHNWALDPDGYARIHGFENSIELCRKMFNDLAKLDSKHPTAGLVCRLLSENRFQLRYTTTVRALALRLLDVNIRAIMSSKSTEGRYDVFGRAYEYLLQKFWQNQEFAEYFTPRHIVGQMIQIIDPRPENSSIILPAGPADSSYAPSSMSEIISSPDNQTFSRERRCSVISKKNTCSLWRK